jgi:hypothetical protein
MSATQKELFESENYEARSPDLPTNHWYTKKFMVDLVRESLGGVIGLDPFADPGKRIETVHGHYTYEDNGLALPWGCGRETDTVFINPGYSHGEPRSAIEKLVEQKNAGNIVGGVALLKAGVLSNKGTQDLIKQNAASICLWKGRIQFDPGEPLLKWREEQRILGKKIPKKLSANNFDICFINFFNEKNRYFYGTFCQYGMVLKID